MSWLIGLLKLIYELVVGDSPALAAAIVAVLGAGIGLLRLDVLPHSLLAIGIASAVFVIAPIVVLTEVRASRARASETAAHRADEA